MARHRNRAERNGSIARHLAGVAMMGLGMLLVMALASYVRSELRFEKSPPDPCTNLIGPAGLLAAHGLLFLYGAGAYLVAALLWAGGALALWSRRFTWPWFTILAFVLLLSGAGLFSLPDQAFEAWRTERQLESAGGVVGAALGRQLMVGMFGSVGAALLLGGVFLTALVLFFRLRPLAIIHGAGPWVWNAVYEWRLRRADQIERLRLEQEKLQRELERAERAERRRGRSAPVPARSRDAVPEPEPEPEDPGPEEDEADELPVPAPEPPRPEPRIIDTSKPVAPVPAAEDDDEDEEDVPAAKSGKASRREPAGDDEAARRSGRGKAGEASLPPVPDPEPFGEYEAPAPAMLVAPDAAGHPATDHDTLAANQQLLIQTFRTFRIDVRPGDITFGPTITRYEFYPAEGVHVERFLNLERNIALAMKAEVVNILAPVPGKDTVAVEIPNSTKRVITLRELIESPAWRDTTARIPLALGQDVYGAPLVTDLAAMPHLLVAGSTGSGKSVCINCILMSLLFRFSPDDLRIILVDPKVVELQVYNGLPHLVVPVVTEPKKVLMALRWVVNEMERRYRLMAAVNVRNIGGFNARPRGKAKSAAAPAPAPSEAPADAEVEGDAVAEDDAPLLTRMSVSTDEPIPDKLPFIVVIIDELADLMQTAPKDVEHAIQRISQKARAAGIHLILATQTPRRQVVTGVIKTNIPCRIAFRVPNGNDSRVILDENGAENLLGKGDMLYLAPGASKLIRASGAFVSDQEVVDIVEFVRAQGPVRFETEIHDKLNGPSGGGELDPEDEELYQRCVDVVLDEAKASTSLLQRRLGLGYGRAAKFMDVLFERGVIGPENGSKPREVLIQHE